MKIHFIGIGGIGVSALAKYYLKKSHKVSGSDLVSSEITEALKKEGAKIRTGKHFAKNLPENTDLVIYSPAVQPDNPELKEAKKRKIKIQSYPEALGELTKKHFTIAVSGTHGKSTTTAMIGLLLIKAGFDPTVIVGTKLKEFGDSNCKVGKSQYLVIEADEHMASFLNYWPKIIVLTTIEADHLDYYKNLKNILKTFKKYIGHLPKDGSLVANKDCSNIQKVVREPSFTYSLKQKEAKKLRKILKVPGEHNVSNALAALTVAQVLKVPDKISFKALSEYRGSWRRFEEKNVTWNGKRITIISDYAHHPTEVKVTLQATRGKYARRKIWCVFQPHQYQRTFYLFGDFVKVLRQALRPGHSAELSRSPQGKPLIDRLIITDIYDVAGREKKKIKEKVSSEKLVKFINKPSVIYQAHKNLCAAVYLPKEKIIEYLRKNLEGKGQVLIIMGAGDVYDLTLRLTKDAKNKKIK